MKVFASYSIKGGVGKTAAAVNLAYLAASEGARTLLWDLDPQAAATFYFRVKPKIKGGGFSLFNPKRALTKAIKGTDFPNLDLLPAEFSHRNLDVLLDGSKKPTRGIKKRLKSIRGDYDYVFIDCPPSISLMSENVFMASDILLVPVIPTVLSQRTLEQLEDFLLDNGYDQLTVMAFFSMTDRRKRMHRQLIEQISAQRSEVLQTSIANSSIVEQMGNERNPVGHFAELSPAAESFQTLWDEVKQRLRPRL